MSADQNVNPFQRLGLLLLLGLAGAYLVPEGPEDLHFGRYPGESLAQWHERHGIVC